MSYWRRKVTVPWVCAVLALPSSTSVAHAQDASEPEEGCDGEGQKGVSVPCAGIEFCTCADKCTTASDCVSECCELGVCLPKCVCEGNGSAQLCKVGDWPPNVRESENGGCTVDRMRCTSPNAGWAVLTLVAGLFAWRRRQE
jgi:MYXO-CTERM domain-containing protein